MIRILKNWAEIGKAVSVLDDSGLPRHRTIERCWDSFLVTESFRGTPRSAPVVDLGCGELDTLNLLSRMGFTHLEGVDLLVGWRQRARQLKRMIAGRTWQPPYYLRRANITKTGFANCTFGGAVCISTLEHGVDLAAFIAEAYRILMNDAILFLTFDYWSSPLPLNDDLLAYGLPWKPFSERSLVEFIALARESGFTLVDEGQLDFETDQPVVRWNSQKFTFGCLVLKKGPVSKSE